ncbi:haloacid dehalogenase-like hydrolase superfamily protein, partial [Striga asiatica]
FNFTPRSNTTSRCVIRGGPPPRRTAWRRRRTRGSRTGARPKLAVGAPLQHAVPEPPPPCDRQNLDSGGNRGGGRFQCIRHVGTLVLQRGSSNVPLAIKDAHFKRALEKISPFVSKEEQICSRVWVKETLEVVIAEIMGLMLMKSPCLSHSGSLDHEVGAMRALFHVFYLAHLLNRMTTYFNKLGWPEKARTDDQERKELIASLHKRKTELFVVLIKKKLLPLRAGVAKLIDQALGNGVQVVVCSTSNENVASYLLAAETLGVDPSSCKKPLKFSWREDFGVSLTLEAYQACINLQSIWFKVRSTKGQRTVELEAAPDIFTHFSMMVTVVTGSFMIWSKIGHNKYWEDRNGGMVPNKGPWDKQKLRRCNYRIINCLMHCFSILSISMTVIVTHELATLPI